MKKKDFPMGWPKEIPLPTIEEAEKAVREIEENAKKLADDFYKLNSFPTKVPDIIIGHIKEVEYECVMFWR